MRPMGARDIGTITSRAFPIRTAACGRIVVRSGRADIRHRQTRRQTAVTTSRANFRQQLNMGEIAAAGSGPTNSQRRHRNRQPSRRGQSSVVEGEPTQAFFAPAARGTRSAIPSRGPLDHTTTSPAFGASRSAAATRPTCIRDDDRERPHTPPVNTKHVAMLLLNLKPDMTPGGSPSRSRLSRPRQRPLPLARPVLRLSQPWTLERTGTRPEAASSCSSGLAAWILHFADSRARQAPHRRPQRRTRARKGQPANRCARRARGSTACSARACRAAELDARTNSASRSRPSLLPARQRTLSAAAHPDPVLAERCLSGMSAELDKAGAITTAEKLRRGARRDLPVDLPALLSECLADMTKSDRLKVPVAADIRPDLIVSGDAMKLGSRHNLERTPRRRTLSTEPAPTSGAVPTASSHARRGR